MRYVSFLLLAIVLASCSVLLKDEKEMDKIIEDIVHDGLEVDY